MTGSVPVPNSSISTSERPAAPRRMFFMFSRCELYVLRSLSIDCSSPMSMNRSSNRPISEFSEAEIRNPFCIMYWSSPTVFRQTDLPPAFGPEMTRMCF